MSAVAAADPSKEADESAKHLAEQVCAACHGQRGLSTLQEIPSLAGQTRVYIAAKLWQFRSQALRRPDQHADLLGVALMDDATVEGLARYFEGQPGPPPVTSDPAAVESGSRIFNEGIEHKGVAACAACHGTDAQGFWITPRLAGQHARYVERQLKEIQLQLRHTRVMHGAVKNLSLEEIKAVAAFVQSK
jgi:cytochrome c553